MTPELHYLALAATFTALLWIPYILNLISRNKLSDAVGYPAAPLPMSPWAERLKKAHYNAIENLAPFAAIVLVAHAAGVNNAATAAAAAAFFWARVVHAFLVKYYGARGRDSLQSLALPLATVTTRDRFGVVTVHGTPHEIVDVGSRMATPAELLRAHDFPTDYDLGPARTRVAKVRLVGNSVCPPVAEALVRANLPTRIAEVA